MVTAVMLLHPGCGGDPGVPRAEHEALLQRLDAMDERLDALEDAIEGAVARGASPSERAVPMPNALGLPGPFPVPDGAERSPTLSVRITLGGIELDGKAFTRDDARAHLREVARTAPSTRIALLAEPDVPYDAVIEAMDLAREAGLTDIAISARVHGEGAVTAGM